MQRTISRWWTIVALLAFVAAGCEHVCLPCAADISPPAVLRIAYISSLSPNSTAAIQFGHSGLAAFLIAVAQVNNASAAWRANTSLPKPRFPNSTIVPVWYDGDNSAAASVNAAYDAATRGVLAIIGDYSSTPAQMIQYVCARAKIPQISPGASIDDFTDNHFSVYPYCMRLVPQIAQQAAQMAAVLRRTFKWRRVATIYASDAFGTGGAVAFAKSAASEGIDILAQVSFNLGETDFTFEINRLVSSEARVLVYWGLAADLINFMRAIKAGAKAGNNPDLLGDGYQFFLCHGGVSKALYTDGNSAPISDVLPWLPGLIGFQYYVDQNTTMWQYFNRLWRQQTWSALTPSVTFQSAPPGEAGRAYDATMQVIRGLAWMYAQKADPVVMGNREDLYNAIRNRTGVGVSGPIQIDRFGDRLTGFGLFNFQQNSASFVNVGVLDENGTFTQFPQARIDYMGKDPTVRPLDRFVRGIVQIPHATVTILLTFTWVILAGIACAQIVLFLSREQNVMRAASPLFLGLFLFGTQLLCASVIPRVLEGNLSYGDQPCVADLYLANLGYTLLVGSLLVKTMRLASILNARQRNKLKTRVTDQKLLCGLAVVLFLETIVLLSLQYGAPMTMRLSEYDSQNDFYSCRAGGNAGSVDDASANSEDSTTPASSTETNEVDTIYLPVTIVTRFALLIATAIMAFRTRKIADVYNESKQLFLTVYNLLFISALLPAIDGWIGRGKQVALIAYCVLVLFISLSSVSIIFLPKLNTLYSHRRAERKAEDKRRRGELSETGGPAWRDGGERENRTRAIDDSPTEVSHTVGTITLEDHTGNTRILTQNAFPPMERFLVEHPSTQRQQTGWNASPARAAGTAMNLGRLSVTKPNSRLHHHTEQGHKLHPEHSRSPASKHKSSSPHCAPALRAAARHVLSDHTRSPSSAIEPYPPATSVMESPVEMQFYNASLGGSQQAVSAIASSSGTSAGTTSSGSATPVEGSENNRLRVHLPRGEGSLSFIHPDSPATPSHSVSPCFGKPSSSTSSSSFPSPGSGGLRLHVSETLVQEFMEFLVWRRSSGYRRASAGVAPQETSKDGETTLAGAAEWTAQDPKHLSPPNHSPSTAPNEFN